ncbi:hypothetical protein [Runella sp.]|uniref:hypothetical protein n=1 Tax=Runella sp. TaxID=1960881 RepID=UPI003D0DA6F5
MDLTLGISTSNLQFEIILGENSTILFNSKSDASLNDNRDIYVLVTRSLESVNRSANEIKKIIVDIGPGGTSVVRTGVAFANGLAYSLEVPVYPVPSMELIGIECWEKYQKPVICTIRSIKNTAYVGLYNDKLVTIKYGPLEEVVKEVASGIDDFIVAGHHRDRIIELFPDKIITDSKIQSCDASLLIEKSDLFLDRAVYTPNYVTPITEQTINLYE